MPVFYSADTLTAISNISIAIAGFSGVVVALTGRSAESFEAVERLNFRILLQVSALALLFSILPLILHRAFEPALAWRISMILYGVVHFADAGFFAWKTRSTETKSYVQYAAPIIGICIALSQITTALLAPIIVVELLYLFVLVWHLAIAGMGFMNLVFASRDEDTT